MKLSCTFCHEILELNYNGIQTTLGWFCYECIKLIHQVADQTVQLRDRPKNEILSDLDNER